MTTAAFTKRQRFCRSPGPRACTGPKRAPGCAAQQAGLLQIRKEHQRSNVEHLTVLKPPSPGLFGMTITPARHWDGLKAVDL